MRPFEYVRAESVQHAVKLAADTGGKFIAGGTNLLDLMKVGVEEPSVVIDISRLELSSIEVTDDGDLAIGALVSNSDLAAHPGVREKYGVLTRALLSGASGQIRNKATTGGNLLQRTRCYYFYQRGMPCNKREPGSGCAALQGFNRIHAILGVTSSCIAAHPSDMAVAMAALGARVEVMSASGTIKTLRLDQLYKFPGDTPHKDTTLLADDLVLRVLMPKPPPGKHVYRKVRDRASYAFALISVAAVVQVHNGAITSLRIALGGVAAMPWRDEKIENLALGRPANNRTFSEVADGLLADSQTYGANDFKPSLARRAIIASLTEASTVS